MRYHHIGIPVPNLNGKSVFCPELMAHGTDPANNPFGISWLVFDNTSCVPERLKSTPYIAFSVDDPILAAQGHRLLFKPEPDTGCESLFIEVDDVPVMLFKCDQANTEPGLYTYHSFWLPTDKPRENDVHLPHLNMSVDNPGNEFGIGWVRYQDDAPYPDIVRQWPHLAFEVEDIKQAIADYQIIIEPNFPQEGLGVGFIEALGAPVEFIQIDYSIHKEGV